jgi:hypothetical protein
VPEDPLVAEAFDADKHAALARAVEQLSPDEANVFLLRLEAAIRKRKIQLLGYLVAMLSWLIAMLMALMYYGMASGFTGWVFLVPFALVGVILYVFGMWANKVGSAAPTLPVALSSHHAQPGGDRDDRRRPDVRVRQEVER